jgi:hypothetical protein
VPWCDASLTLVVYLWAVLRQVTGGAVLVHEGGSIDQRKTTFQSNSCLFLFPSGFSCADDGVGIANQGGEVLCDESGCLPVCTTCLTPSPTPQPTVAKPTPHPTALLRTALPSTVQVTGSNHRSESKTLLSNLPFVFGSSLALLTVCAAVAVVWRRRTRRCVSVGDAEEMLLPSNQQPILRLVNDGGAESESVELVAHSMMKSHETSPGEN